MATNERNRNVVVGVFESRERAQQAISELKRSGFQEDQIGVAARDEEGGEHIQGEDRSGKSYAGEGAVGGAAVGAGAGALWGLGIVAGILPAIGPAIAGGTLVAVLASAAGGAAAAGIAGALVGLGISKEEAEYYEQEFRAGRTIVTVKAGDHSADAEQILRRYGAYDMHNRTPDTAARETTLQEGAGAHGREGTTVQAREEQLHAHKQPVQKGEAHVRKEVRTEHQTLEVPVEREELVVERHPGSGQAARGPIGEEKDIRIPLREEEVRVEKTPVVKEEVTVGKRKVQDSEMVGGTVRKEDIKVEGDVGKKEHQR